MKTKLTFTKVDLSKRYYMIDLDDKRMGDYDALEEIRNKWIIGGESQAGCGNVSAECAFDLLKGKIVWGGWNNPGAFYISNIIDSPLLLYRLICVFNEPPETEKDPYKTVWWYHIKHKPSGKVLAFGEWKGAARFWLPETNHTKLKPEFKKDLEDLLLFLVSDQIPHPYDGCTAGQIA